MMLHRSREEAAPGRHRSGATESGPTPHQLVLAAGVLALAGVLVLLVTGAVARIHADDTRTRAQEDSGEIGGRLVSMRADSHEVHMVAARYFEAWRAYVEAARRYGETSAVSAQTDGVAGAALADASGGDPQDAIAEADGPLRDLEAARISLADARRRVDAAWDDLIKAGVLPPRGGQQPDTAGKDASDAPPGP